MHDETRYCSNCGHHVDEDCFCSLAIREQRELVGPDQAAAIREANDEKRIRRARQRSEIVRRSRLLSERAREARRLDRIGVMGY